MKAIYRNKGRDYLTFEKREIHLELNQLNKVAKR